MTIIYFIIGALFGLAGMAILRRYTSNENWFSLGAAVSVALGILLAKVCIVPQYHAATYAYFLKKENPGLAIIEDKFTAKSAEFINLASKVIFH